MFLYGGSLGAQSANPYGQGSAGYPEVQSFPHGSTFGSGYQGPPTQYQQAYPQQQNGYQMAAGQQAYPQAQPYSQQPNYQGQPSYQSQPSYQDQSGYQGQANASGQSQDFAADQQHSAARISVVDGQANVRRGDNGEMVAAAINAPLLSQDHLVTAGDGRSEVELDSGDVIRIAPNTDVAFASLQYNNYQVQLGVGSILYRVLRDTGAQAEIDTPSLAVHPTQPGEYRVSVYDDGAAQITVRSGALQIVTSSGSQWLSAGQSILVTGNASNPEIRAVAAPGMDGLDSWGQERDRLMLSSPSSRYLTPDMAGAEDLDANGSWVSSQYGEVWEPRVASGWAPYSDGSWAYEPYYGWTWVDAAPWGWAPFHYGRWFYNGGFGWCWWPGAHRVGFGWSPAAVGFYGLGGGIGWVALAPYEPPCRWWGLSIGISFHFGGGWGYGRGDVWHAYHNLGYRGGAVWAPYNRFGGYHGQFSFAGRAELSRASWINGRFPVQPTRASYGFTNRQAFAVNSHLQAASNRTFFNASRVNGSFSRGQTFTGQNYGGRQQNFSNSRQGYQRQNGYPADRGSASMHGVPPSSAQGQRSSSSGWHSFGQAGNGAVVRQGFYGSQEGGGVWHNFGQSQHGVPPAHNSTPATGYSNGYGARSTAGNPQSQRYSAPQNERLPQVQYGSGPSHYNSPSYGAPRYNSAPQHFSAPSYSAPHYNSAPAYSAPHYSAPSYSAPHYSAPSGGASHYSAPRESGGSYHGGGGGGSSHSGSSGGGGSHGGGGGHHH
jgi:hypothetical protein